jgi:acyl-coenzyme A thioesterase PaaI-like protein
VRNGWVTGTATALRIGRTLATYDVSLTNDEGEQICAARITVALRRAGAADPETD